MNPRPVSHGTVYMTFLAVIVFAACPPVGIWLLPIPFFMHRANKRKIAQIRAVHQRRREVQHERMMIAVFKSLG